MNDDLCLTPATELAAAIRSRDVSPVDIVEAVLARIEALNEQVHAFITVDADGALESARAAEAAVMAGEALGPLHGLPVSIKDLEPVAGLRCTYGSKFFEANIADIDGIVTERTKAAGGIIIGKTNACHSGHKDMCDNLIGPPCRNPWKLDRTSGGSSVSRLKSARCNTQHSVVPFAITVALLGRSRRSAISPKKAPLCSSVKVCWSASPWFRTTSAEPLVIT